MNQISGSLDHQLHLKLCDFNHLILTAVLLKCIVLSKYRNHGTTDPNEQHIKY